MSNNVKAVDTRRPTLSSVDSAIVVHDAQNSSSTKASATADSDPPAHAQILLREAILTRHSSRLYLPKPVPRALLDKALELARQSPSDTNTQIWRTFIVTGAALSTLKTELTARARMDDEPNIPGPPAEFAGYRSKLGALLYGVGWGIPRDDRARRREAVLRNFDFFGAPVAVIVCMSRELPGKAALSVGMYMQTLMLALTEMGLQSCAMISTTGYPDVVKRAVGIPENLDVLCGMSIGYEDVDAGVNWVRAEREPVDKTTVWVE